MPMDWLYMWGVNAEPQPTAEEFLLCISELKAHGMITYDQAGNDTVVTLVPRTASDLD